MHDDPSARRTADDLRMLPIDRYGEFKPAGEGGMGIVYWAIDTDLNREVAFKVIRPMVGEGTVTPDRPTDLATPEKNSAASDSFEALKQRFLQEDLAETLLALKRYADAAMQSEAAYALRVKAGGAASEGARWTARQLQRIHAAWGKPAKAAAWKRLAGE